MDKAVAKYKKRRQSRLDARYGKEIDTVGEFRKRRQKRMDANVGWVYGLAKAKGIDTTGMEPKDVFEALKEKGVSAAKGRPEKSSGRKKKNNNNSTNTVKHYISSDESSRAPVVGGYKRKNRFKNGYGRTEVGKEEREDLVNGLTMHDNTDENGNWTEEREALHSKIIDKFFSSAKKPKGVPETIFMGGGPASGKSYVRKQFGKDFGIPDGCVLADPDECKKMLDEYDERRPWFVHEESSSIAKRIAKLAQENGYSTLVDGTGDGSVEKMRAKIRQAKKNGNYVKGRYVFMPVEDAIQLNHKRDRSVDPKRLVDTHKKISSILPEIAADFDDVELYANTIGGKPKLIAKGGNGQGLQILDKDLYQKFLDNGKYEYNKDRVMQLERTPFARKTTKRYKIKK